MSAVSGLKRSNRAKDLKKIWHEPVLLGVILLVIISLIIFIIYPLASILVQSISPKTGGISLASYVDVLGNSSFQLALKNTLVLGTIVGTLATLIGFVFAYADSYIKTRFKGIFKVVSLLPIVSPPFVLALSAIMLFGQRGLITMRLLGLSDFNIYGLKGLVMVQVMTFFPVSYLMLVGLLGNIDPSIEESARNMGASRWKVFTSTTLPLMLPGIANSFLITFIEVVADFANPMAIGGSYSTLATQIYLQAVGNYNMDTGTATAVILLVLSIGLFVFEKYWIERKSYITITGKAARGRVLIEDKSVVIPINIFCVCVTIFVLSFYLLIPLGSFFKLWGMDYSLTTKHYKYIFDMGFKPFVDTVYLSAIATP
ncbi:MAG: iron ABC transporter permease, partial [Angelakisella sp.]